MERGPLPPHERTWRHPSELAAEERAVVLAEPTPRSVRVMALTSGTMGLLAVGLLMVTITPARGESPIAISASTTPAADTESNQPIALAPGATERVGFRSDIGGALATPIGDGRFALVTRAALADVDHMIIDVRLPSGRTTAGSIVTASDQAVVVALAAIEPGHGVAVRRPAADQMVTVMADPPVVVAYSQIATLEVGEGTAVLDDDGLLVGLCSRRRGADHMHLIEVLEELDDATNVVPPASP
ncbi:MAG: hypothetical protein ABIP17_12375 [Ilumatobacteraceae bacterium]